ncbi:MAG: glycosyltransferase family 4 protein [Candidatus Ranarchaeia archaeon]
MHSLFIAKLPGWSDRAWGGDVHTTQLASYLVREGLTVTYLNDEFEGTRNGIKFLRIPYTSYRKRPYYPEKEALTDLLTSEIPDIVHHFSTMGFTFEQLRNSDQKIAKIPSVCSLWTSRLSVSEVDSSWGLIKKGKLFRALAAEREKWSAQQADRVGVASEAMRQELIRLFDLDQTKIESIPRGVELDLFRHALFPKRTSGEGVVLYAGRIEKKKGLEPLVRAMKIMTSDNPHTTLRFVGQGKDKDHLNKIACDLGVAENIEWIDRIPNNEMPHEYAQADIVALLSSFEPFGAIIIEAGAVGRPAIVTKSGGPSELVINGKTGIIIDPCNEKTIAEALIQSFNDRKKLIQMGINAREHVTQKYTFESEAQNYHRLYQQITS